MSVTDFIRETAAYLVRDRPDVYEDHADAVGEINSAIEYLRSAPDDENVSVLTFTSYIMIRVYDDGVEEFFFTRKMASLALFEEEQICSAFSQHPDVNLPELTLDDRDDM